MEYHPWVHFWQIGLEFFLRCNFDINKVRIKLSSFHKQVFLLWMLVFKHNFSPHKSVIWNNKYIKFKNKSLFYRNWYNKGIILVRQLFKNNGNLFNYCEFLNYYKIPITAKEFAVVLRVCVTFVSWVHRWRGGDSHSESRVTLGLGDMAQKIITIIIFISVDIDNYHDKCQIFISFKFKARFLLQSESFRNQTINFP